MCYIKAIQSRAWRIHLQQFFKDLDSEKPRICVVSHFRNLENTQKKIVTHRLHHTCTSILIRFRGAFLCPKASETAWISKSNRSLERVQKQKKRLRFPSEPVFCLRKRFFVGKNAPKIFWNAPVFKTKRNRRTCDDIRKIRRFVLTLDFCSV